MSLPPADAVSPATAPARPKRHVLAGGKRLLARLAGRLVRAWVFSLRVSAAPSTEAMLRYTARPTLFVLWHNRLFIAAEVARRYRPTRPLHALISTSKDGAWLTAFFESMGFAAVRGSSSKGGREAASELVRHLREGADAGITPDGPRGPVYVAKAGALTVARRSGARVVLLGAIYEQAWRLRSWDAFLLPRPFSRVRLITREFSADELARDDALARLEAILLALNVDLPARETTKTTETAALRRSPII